MSLLYSQSEVGVRCYCLPYFIQVFNSRWVYDIIMFIEKYFFNAVEFTKLIPYSIVVSLLTFHFVFLCYLPQYANRTSTDVGLAIALTVHVAVIASVTAPMAMMRTLAAVSILIKVKKNILSSQI